MPCFRSSLALLVRYRTPRVFSLGCVYHPFALHYQAALLVPRARAGAVTRAGAAFQRLASHAPQRRSLPMGLLPVRSPLLRESTFVSSPVLTDMLKSGTSPRPAGAIRAAAAAGRLSRAYAPVIACGAYGSRTEAVSDRAWGRASTGGCPRAAHGARRRRGGATARETRVRGRRASITAASLGSACVCAPCATYYKFTFSTRV
ncbi:hypothetical protein NEAUS03_2266 [Nematocida ausubeli]|nr:hypothetical protein NEAUS03_2266 [Nematocida ausubeli]KAI5187442.1 hypothetical protein NEIRO03_2536 [Nematocida sp. AWRm78]